ncbi:MAG: hypothetical protein IPQ09_23465 [Myxococcales bacterium]|nr:hypothetical protein [Myxococcales bacterium]
MPCERLVAVALPEIRGFTTVARAGAATQIEASTADHHGTTIEEVVLGGFIVRYAMSSPTPVGQWIELRAAGCDGPSVRAQPYWNGGPLTLLRRGDVFVVAWRAGGGREDLPLIAFERANRADAR